MAKGRRSRAAEARERARLTAIAAAFHQHGVPMHRDTLAAILGDRNPNLFANPADVGVFVREHPAAFPALGDGVFWSQLEELRRAARDDPTPATFVDLAEFSWSVVRDATTAEEAYGEALCREIDGLRAHRGLATLLMHQERWSESAGLLAWLRSHVPDDRRVMELSAKCSERLEDWEFAVDLWARLVELFPGDSGYRLRLGAAAFQADDADTAEDALNTVLAIDDEVAAAHLLLAQLAFERGDIDKASLH